MTSPSSILVELIIPTSLPDKKPVILSTFRSIFDISTAAAVPGVVDPGLGFKTYNTVSSNPDQSAIMLLWKDLEHHDALAATPGFAEGGRLFGEQVVPNVQGGMGGLDIVYLTVRGEGVEVAMNGEGEAAEVLELKVSGSLDDQKAEEAVAKAFQSLNPPKGFLGYFSGPKNKEPGTFFVVMKYSSKDAVDDNAWAKESEKAVLGSLGGDGASVVRRLKLSD